MDCCYCTVLYSQHIQTYQHNSIDTVFSPNRLHFFMWAHHCSYVVFMSCSCFIVHLLFSLPLFQWSPVSYIILPAIYHTAPIKWRKKKEKESSPWISKSQNGHQQGEHHEKKRSHCTCSAKQLPKWETESDKEWYKKNIYWKLYSPARSSLASCILSQIAQSPLWILYYLDSERECEGEKKSPGWLAGQSFWQDDSLNFV